MAPNEYLGEITVFKKSGGPLTKHLALRDGKIVNDSAACFMAHGSAHRVEIDSVQALADLINNFASNQAYALGRLKDGVPDGAEVVRKDELNGMKGPSVIARTKDYVVFKEGEPGLVLLDIDVKDMPETVKRRIEECGGVLSALCKVLPEFKNVARVERASTSSGLRNKQTGETYQGSGGMHIVIPVLDAADILRFLRDLHARLWLAGFGWGAVAAAGAFLERSPVDRLCGSPERLIFEAKPTLGPSLEQDPRNAFAHDGDILDTRLCAPLTDAEKSKLNKLKAAERARLLPELEAVREAWAAKHIKRLTARGMPEAEARARVDRWIDWQELSGDFPLPFDDATIADTTVADVLAAPDRYINKTLSDPFEGPAYGRGKAKLFRRADGSLSVYSFAHGGIKYELKADTTAGLILPRGYKLNGDGLWFRKQDEDAPPVKVCGPFTIEARTSDDSHDNHGLLLKWIDLDGEHHKWPMPIELVHADGGAIAAELHSAGLRCNTSRPAHELLKRFFGEVIVPRHVRCVDHAGWHGALYVLPNGRVFGVDAGSIVLQTERVAAGSGYVERGTLDEWRDNVARHAIGNDLLVLSISTAFAAPLLDVLREPSGGVHLHGTSQSGKTTTVRCAKSVYGPADDKHMRTWRATANGLEAVAAENSDGLLVLDEIVQAIARELEQVVYMLANNAGKARASRAGGARRQINWRLLFLSTGEMTAEAKLAEAGQRVRAGQDVRLIGLSADAGADMGVFQNLHDFPSAAALAEHLRAMTSTYCGTAGPAYLNQLARERAGDPKALTTTLDTLCQQFLDANVPSDADGQVRSVGKRFALIAAAGELATAYDITGWSDDEALRAAGACFKRWLSARGGAGATEDIQAVEQVSAFIAVHGSSRFETLRAFAGSSEEVPDDRVVNNRAGWKRLKDGEWEYLIPTDVWKREVCAGLDPSRVAVVLAKRGFLLGARERHKADSIRITGYPRRMRLYRVSAAILGDETNGK